MQLIQQNTTTEPIPLLMVLSSDHVTGATGKTLTVTLSKNGAAFGAAAGAVVELTAGRYYLTGHATDRNTLGPLMVHVTAADCDPYDVDVQVVAFDPRNAVRLGLTALPSAAADAAGGLPISDAGGLDLDAIGTNAGRCDVLTSSRLPSSGNAGTSGVLLGDEEDVYPADIQCTIDAANGKDEYTVQWFRNGSPVVSGVTVPLIQVVKRAEGTDLIASTAMTQIGSTGAYKYDATTSGERNTAGEAVLVHVSATINGSTRTWRKLITRDSAA